MDDIDEMPYGSQDFDEDEEGESDDLYEDELEEALSNCGMMVSGICMKAGSEECDWECPFSG